MTKRPPQGAMTQAQRAVTPAEEAAFAALELELGGRGKLVQILSVAQLPKDIDQVLGMIADPIHDHESLAKICALGRVSLSKLLKVFEGAQLARGQVIAHSRIASALPDVAAAVMAAATPGWRDCLDCMGTREVAQMVPNVTEEGKPAPGQHEEMVPCGTCRGRGLVYHYPDHDVQKTALKIGKILDTGKGGAGVNVAVLQNVGQPGETANFDQLMTRLDGALYGTGRDRMQQSGARVVEGEVADDGE